MKSNYKPLGKYIQPVVGRNNDLGDLPLVGLSIQKKFIPSIANTIGTDMSTYRIIERNQFAYGPVTSRNGDKITIALFNDFDKALISQAYIPFEVKDPNELDPEYLMMWFRRPEFDRYARFKSHGSAREIFDWEEMSNALLPIPHITKQKEIVKEYNVIQNRIAINRQLIQKLEATAQAIYKQWFVEDLNDNWEIKTLNDLCSLITDGKHGDCEDEEKSGYYFLSAKDLRNNSLIFQDARQITKKDFEETHRRTNLKPGDICMVNTGATIGRMSIAPNNLLTFKSTFQKSVAVLKPRDKVTKSYYLFCLLSSNIKEITELGSGTSQPNLLLGDLKKYIIKYPNYGRIEEFENKITPVFQARNLKVEENILLIQLKDLLLSKLATIEN